MKLQRRVGVWHDGRPAPAGGGDLRVGLRRPVLLGQCATSRAYPSSSPPPWIPGLSLACWHVVCMSIAPIGATPPVATALRHTPAAVASKRAITTQQSDTVPTLAQACGLSLLLSLQPRPITVPSRAVHVARALRFACGA